LDFHSEIQFSVSLISLEELYFNKLKNTNSSNKPSNKVKWNEFKELTLNCFFTNPKFVAEKKFFQSFIKRLSNNIAKRNKYYLKLVIDFKKFYLTYLFV